MPTQRHTTLSYFYDTRSHRHTETSGWSQPVDALNCLRSLAGRRLTQGDRIPTLSTFASLLLMSLAGPSAHTPLPMQRGDHQRSYALRTGASSCLINSHRDARSSPTRGDDGYKMRMLLI
jgi:hypothetical protein